MLAYNCHIMQPSFSHVHDIVVHAPDCIILGPKNPKQGINVFLQPIIEELNVLWEHGVNAFDVPMKQICNESSSYVDHKWFSNVQHVI